MKNYFIQSANLTCINHDRGNFTLIPCLVAGRIPFRLLRFVVNQKGLKSRKLGIRDILRRVGAFIVEDNADTDPQLAHAGFPQSVCPLPSMMIQSSPKVGRLAYVVYFPAFVDSINSFVIRLCSAFNRIKREEPCPLNLKALNRHAAIIGGL